MYAVSINDWDWGNIQGTPKFFRLFTGMKEPRKKIQGSDIAGVVEAVGKRVTQFKPGDEVYGDISGRWGGFAEYVCAPAKMLVLKPPVMSFEQAAAIPQAGMLAVQGLRAGKIRPGIKILVNGAGGGVGTFAVQIARTYEGIEMTGVDSAMKLDMIRSMGYDHVIDYVKEDFTANGVEYDLILDTKTNRPLSHYVRSLAPGGTYATVGGDLDKCFGVLFLGPLVTLGNNKKLRLVMLRPNRDLPYMNELYTAGKLRALIDGPYALIEVPKAFEIFGKGEHKGKLVVRVLEQ